MEQAKTTTTWYEEQEKKGKPFLSWWETLVDKEKGDRGRRAELRRARSVEEIVLAPALHDLRKALRGTKLYKIDRLCVVAGVLAHVDAHHNDKTQDDLVATRMASPKQGGSGPRVSELRFRRLLQIADDDHDRLFRQMVRVCNLLRSPGGRTVNVIDLALSLYWWNERTRRRWAIAYYDMLPEKKKA